MTDYKPGDLVMLLSGGPWLTVEEIRADPEPSQLLVAWFDDRDDLHRTILAASSVEPTREDSRRHTLESARREDNGYDA